MTKRMPSICEALCGDKECLEPLSIYVTDAAVTPKKIGEIPKLDSDGSCNFKCTLLLPHPEEEVNACLLGWSINKYGLMIPGPNCPRWKEK